MSAHSPLETCPYTPSGINHTKRWTSAEVLGLSSAEEAFDLTDTARQAWRESVRCIGRLHWRSLHVIDARSLEDADSIFDACVEHLRSATNGGRITPTQTVFPEWNPDSEHRIRIWNHQLIRYAGYRQADGSVLGDPMNLAFTDIVRSLGWTPPREPGRFDLLPLVIEAGGKLAIRDLPRDCVLEVSMEHPSLPWFGKLGLRWYAVPAISDMILAAPGHAFPCAPFNGWYMGTEIGSRNFGDANRYDLLPELAARLGIPRSQRLWKDQALLILNEAVLHSFERDGIRIIDHHQASREFIAHCQREEALGHEVQAEWAWIVPPLSGSATGVFHRNYPLQPRLPNLLPQAEAWNSPQGMALLRQHQRPS